MSGIRERLEMLSRGELMGLAVVLVTTLAGAGLWYARSLPKSVQVAATPANATPANVASAGITQPEPSPTLPLAGVAASGSIVVSGSVAPASPAVLIVDVAGWVRKPGVYEFEQDDRIVDAVDRAG